MRRLISTPSFLKPLIIPPGRVLILSFILHVLAAYLSIGFFHYDEQFQVLEYVSFKLGHTPAQQLAWEFKEQIRPWFQPSVYYAIAKVVSFLNPTPATLAFLFRLTGALLGFLGLCILVKKEKKSAALVCLFFILPFLHARTSSESFAASFFTLGYALFDSKKRWQILISGLALGFSFESRFQMAIALLGLVAYQFWKNKKISPHWIAGFLIAFAIGRLTDYWGYGTGTLTPWRYFAQNLIEDKASQFGTLPPWGYFQLLLLPKEGLLPIGLLLLLASVYFWYKYPKHPLTWVTLPFFVIHSLIPHKEVRFLFPMLPFVALMIAPLIRGKIVKPFWVINTVLLLYFSLSPCKNQIRFVSELSKRFPDKLELYGTNRDPFQEIHRLYFYQPKEYTYHQNQTTTEPHWVYTEKPIAPRADCKLEYQTLPAYLKYLNVNGWYNRAANWSLFFCGRQP